MPLEVEAAFDVKRMLRVKRPTSAWYSTLKNNSNTTGMKTFILEILCWFHDNVRQQHVASSSSTEQEVVRSCSCASCKAWEAAAIPEEQLSQQQQGHQQQHHHHYHQQQHNDSSNRASNRMPWQQQLAALSFARYTNHIKSLNLKTLQFKFSSFITTYPLILVKQALPLCP